VKVIKVADDEDEVKIVKINHDDDQNYQNMGFEEIKEQEYQIQQFG